MLWDTLTTRQQALHLIRVLKVLKTADGQIAPEEAAFVTQVGLHRGLTLGDIQAELSSAETEAAFPTEEQDRMAVLYYLVFLSKADGGVDEAEAASVHRFGLRLGFRPEMVSQFIALAREHGREGIAPAEMLGRIRQYLN